MFITELLVHVFKTQILYQHAPCMPSHVCQILRQSEYALKFYGSFLQVCKKKEKWKKTLASFY